MPASRSRKLWAGRLPAVLAAALLGGGLLLAFVSGLGPSGIWLGMVIGLFCAAVLLSLRLRWRVKQPISRRLITG